MGPNFTPLSVPRSPSIPPSSPHRPKRKFDKQALMVLSGVIVFVGVIAGYIAMQNGFIFKPRATYEDDLSCGGACHSTSQCNPGLTCDVAAHLSTWSSVAGKCVLTKCLEAGTVCSADKCTIILPTATPKPTNTPTKPPPTSTPKPSPTPTRVPVCGSTCSTDSQCPTGLKCFTTAIGTFTSPTGKCVLAKCLVAGTVCTADKCTVIPPTPTPTPTNTPTPTKTPPTATISCPKPNPVKNLRINCPICKGS